MKYMYLHPVGFFMSDSGVGFIFHRSECNVLTMCFSCFLCFSVDKGGISFHPGMHVIVHPDGKVIWFSPAILTSSCRQRVKYFPFDTQVCLLRFASWSFHSKQIDFWPEEGPDSVQSRWVQVFKKVRQSRHSVTKRLKATLWRRLSEFRGTCCESKSSKKYGNAGTAFYSIVDNHSTTCSTTFGWIVLNRTQFSPSLIIIIDPIMQVSL